MLSSRENLSAAFFAIAIGCILTEPIIVSPLFWMYAFAIYLGLSLLSLNVRHIKPPPELILCGVVLASSLVAIPLSLLFEGHQWAATMFLAVLTLLLAPLLLVTNTTKVFYALIPLCYFQAIVMWWQWSVTGLYRASGIALNANAGSSLLLVGAIFLLTQPRYKWLAVPLLVTIPLSGSRWVAVVGALIIGLIFVTRYIPWKYVLVGIIAGFIILTAAYRADILSAYRVDGTPSTTASLPGDVVWRLTPKDSLLTWEILIPKGFINSQIHNVPYRMVTETGLLSGLAWLGVTGLILLRKPRYTYAWWLLLTVALLSQMYYFTWIGPLGALWWLLVAELRTKKDRLPVENRRSRSGDEGFISDNIS